MPGNMTKGVKYGMISVTIWIELSLLEQFRLKNCLQNIYCSEKFIIASKNKNNTL